MICVQKETRLASAEVNGDEAHGAPASSAAKRETRVEGELRADRSWQ